MLQNLITDHVIKFFVFEGQVFSICMYKMLMRKDFYISASVRIIIDVFINNHIRTIERIMPRTDF